MLFFQNDTGEFCNQIKNSWNFFRFWWFYCNLTGNGNQNLDRIASTFFFLFLTLFGAYSFDFDLSVLITIIVTTTEYLLKIDEKWLVCSWCVEFECVEHTVLHSHVFVFDFMRWVSIFCYFNLNQTKPQLKHNSQRWTRLITINQIEFIKGSHFVFDGNVFQWCKLVVTSQCRLPQSWLVTYIIGSLIQV